VTSDEITSDNHFSGKDGPLRGRPIASELNTCTFSRELNQLLDTATKREMCKKIFIELEKENGEWEARAFVVYLDLVGRVAEFP